MLSSDLTKTEIPALYLKMVEDFEIAASEHSDYNTTD
jgi:hypothetical protein